MLFRSPIVRPAPVNPATGRAQLGGKASSASTSPRTPRVAAQPAATSTQSPPTAAHEATAPPSVNASATVNSSGIVADHQVLAKWPEVLASLKPLVRALYSAVQPSTCVDGVVTVVAPNPTHSTKAHEHVAAVQDALSRFCGRAITVKFDEPASSSTGQSRRPVAEAPSDDIGEPVDMNDLVDAPRGAANSTVDRLSQAFPGSKVVDNAK